MLSQIERRLQDLQSQITILHEEKADALEQYIKMQKENKILKEQIFNLEMEEKKLQKRLQVHYKAKENELRATFYEKQDETAETEKRNSELVNKVAELQDQNMELEQYITKLENGTFGLSEAMDRVKELKRDVETSNNKISIRTKELNEALRKIEDLHEEVRLLRDHVRKTDPEFKQIQHMVGFDPISDADRNTELEWVGMRDGFRLDISAYKVKTAMELEKSKAMILQLEREVEALETERLEMKSQLRLFSLQRGERAAKLGLSAADIEKLDQFADQLKSGESHPLVDSGLSTGDKNKQRKLQERVDKLDKQLKDKDKELGTALETIDKLKEDMRASTSVKDAIDDLKRFQEELNANYQQMYMQADAESRQQEASAAPDTRSVAVETTPARPRRLEGSDGVPGSQMKGTPMRFMPMMGQNMFEQLAKAMRDGDMAEQAHVDVTIAACRNCECQTYFGCAHLFAL
jgi:chromosome segregation ATPase